VAKTWLCGCGTRNERIKQKCSNPDCDRRRPKKRVARHAQALRDGSYEHFREVNETIHGPAFGGEWDADCCGVCGKHPSQERHNDRDHGHRRGDPAYGKARGLACGGDTGCNVLMVPWVTAAAAYGIAVMKQAADEPDAERWVLIARYLRRVEDYYSGVAARDAVTA